MSAEGIGAAFVQALVFDRYQVVVALRKLEKLRQLADAMIATALVVHASSPGLLTD